MNDRLVLQIRNNMESKGTEELLTIWEENDRTQYSDEAFLAIREILTQRGEEIPRQ